MTLIDILPIVNRAHLSRNQTFLFFQSQLYNFEFELQQARKKHHLPHHNCTQSTVCWWTHCTVGKLDYFFMMFLMFFLIALFKFICCCVEGLTKILTYSGVKEDSSVKLLSVFIYVFI